MYKSRFVVNVYVRERYVISDSELYKDEIFLRLLFNCKINKL